ncbi:MAG: glycosyltransferase [Marinobacter sp.]|uniref:glycosyltransferase n=1 Tax=Marinobacter sp. TaxID=50741 RepID=UPI001B6660A8|nr:glycosyltransferase [Marinobacter sp.]MBQ0747911.1 glycosyltransferase [Marinobacter sp.]MBQ0815019.1 glycosyltransferase [Marinobacter sp.]
MRIGVVRTQVPFVTGGAERHAAGLVQALRQYGHEACEITLPFKWYPVETLTDSILSARLMDLTEAEGVPIEMMIGLKFPAYLARHPNPVFWLIHQHRQAYDMWDAGTSDLLDSPDGMMARDMIQAEDRAAFARSTRPIYANSQNVAGRLERYLGLGAEALYHPPPLASRLTQGSFGDYLFAPGRLNPSKRVDLMLRALAKVPGSLRLVIAGVPENPAYLDELRSLAAALGVSGRVDWLGAIDDDTMIRHYAEARAVVFTPRDEDLGYITLEAMLSGKPVITTTDAGGPLEFITQNREGLVTAPDAQALAEAFLRLSEDVGLAETMGLAGLERYRGLNISWEHVVETLTGEAAKADPGPAEYAALEARIAATPAQEAMARVQAAVAPPPAPPLPFASIAEVLQAYAFDTMPPEKGEDVAPVEPGLAKYLGTHWTRYQTTLRHVVDCAPRDVLDVGVFPPLVFEAMVVNALPDVKMSGIWEGPNPYAQSVKSLNPAYPDFDMELRTANIERDVMPYGDAEFDMVLGMEIFEHLALDPLFFLSQAARVLRPGGHIILTTPNVGSHRGLQRMLHQQSPYSFGVFVPTGGVYGRHNREYTPHEVEALAHSAGFETHHLSTVDVYESRVDPSIAALMIAREDELNLRGETIVFVGRKAGSPTAPPPGLYHGDPARLSGRLTVTKDEPATGLTQITAHNTSSSWWPVSGNQATALLAEWINAEDYLVHTNVVLPLDEAVAPGEKTTFNFRRDRDAAASAGGTLKMQLLQTGVGVFTGTGRANMVMLPCSEAAFLALARRAL